MEKRSEDYPRYVYLGNLSPNEHQYKSGVFTGLALRPKYDRDIAHDIREPFPFPDGSLEGCQAQDVLEHVRLDYVPEILNEIYRCLAPNAIFRLSLPDYNSPLLRSRTVYDCNGRPLCDLAMGGKISGKMAGGIDVQFDNTGDQHVWFPTYLDMLEVIVRSDIRKCVAIDFHHVWLNRSKYICNDFDNTLMPILRCPPRDMRADGGPISIIIDFVK